MKLTHFLLLVTLTITLVLCQKNCVIPNCEQCHGGFTGEACDRCTAGWGVCKKVFGNDQCVDCNSAVPHCTACANTKIWWNCYACESGYKLIQVPTGDDLCVKSGDVSDAVVIDGFAPKL